MTSADKTGEETMMRKTFSNERLSLVSRERMSKVKDVAVSSFFSSGRNSSVRERLSRLIKSADNSFDNSVPTTPFSPLMSPKSPKSPNFHSALSA